eukprot:3183816-Amphidinium_carterae.1
MEVCARPDTSDPWMTKGYNALIIVILKWRRSFDRPVVKHNMLSHGGMQSCRQSKVALSAVAVQSLCTSTFVACTCLHVQAPKPIKPPNS